MISPAKGFELCPACGGCLAECHQCHGEGVIASASSAHQRQRASQPQPQRQCQRVSVRPRVLGKERVLKKMKVRGVTPVAGRGPLSGRVRVFGPHDSDIACRVIFGMCSGEIRVCVTRSRNPCVGWFRDFLDPVVAETMAVTIAALGTISETQLESLGFVEDRRPISSPNRKS